MSNQTPEEVWKSMFGNPGDDFNISNEENKRKLINSLKKYGAPPFGNYTNGFIKYVSGNQSSNSITKKDFINALNKFPPNMKISKKLWAISVIGDHNAFVPITSSPSDKKECQYLLRKTTENVPCILEIFLMQNGELTFKKWKLFFGGSGFTIDGETYESLDDIIKKCINTVESCSPAVAYTMSKK